MAKKKLTKTDKAFYQGVLVALGIVSPFNMTAYDEIVKAVGAEGLIVVAKDSGSDFDIAHLQMHGVMPSTAS